MHVSRPATAHPSHIALHRLPVQLRMLVRVMGEAGAYTLVQRRGGTPLTVPKHPHSAQGRRAVERLVSDCGCTMAAAALVAEMPGETMMLPKYDAVVRQLRHQRVVELRAQRRRIADIALDVGYSVRQVINVLNASGVVDVGPDEGDNRALAGRQADLFGAIGGDCTVED
jgi:hypothetical protein